MLHGFKILKNECASIINLKRKNTVQKSTNK